MRGFRHRCGRGLLAAAALVLAWGCGGSGAGGGAGQSPGADGEALSRATEEGPVKATVTLEPASPRLGDPLTLTLEVEAEPDVTVEMPAFGEALGRFSIVDFTPRRETRPDGGTVASQRYTLQAPMSGKQRIPPLRIEFLDQRAGQVQDDDSDTYRELLTDEITVDVASVLPEGTVVEDLRPVRPPLEELPGPFRPRNWILLAALLGAASALIAWWVRRRRRAAERARITAYDRAMRRFRALEKRGFPSPEEADAWYVELSGIVRHYLEDRYGVRAPELTTEEFLQEARRSPELTASHRDLLTSFLERCDRVKFAAYQPQVTESGEALEAARRFLDETRFVPESERPAAEKPAA